ncbi:MULTISPECIES: phospholipase D-like domain-containing protein [unclassified Microcoleus]|uniref:phospholipase D-like domain-containing protein n=1 Tax=unclassified Microcoleus TaxID=2642155 RepID=UPI002FCE7E63
MNKKIVALAVLILAGFASCQLMKPKAVEEIPAAPVVKALPQDPSLQVYFNQSQTSSYTEPYRQVTRSGHDLEQLMVYSINSARESVDVAVQELRLPRIAQALAHRHRSGIKVRVIIENLYNRPIALSASQIASLPKRERDRYAELVNLADIDKDGSLSDAEISSGDALAIVREAGIPMIDDTADGSKGSGLMHHKFIIIDGKTVIATSANFTTSDIHGDFKSAESRGNPNNLLKMQSPELAKVFTEEFSLMWGDGPGGKPDSKFGVKKSIRPIARVQVGGATVAVQFSPATSKTPWQQTPNGLIDRTLATASKSVNLALFVFSAQQLADTLETKSRTGVGIRALVDSSFVYRPYSEAMDMMGASLLDGCKLEVENRPWSQPLATVGMPKLPVGDRLHHKFGVVDGTKVITGSHNWSEAANRANDETLLVVESATVGAHFEQEFDRLYQGAILGLPQRIKQKMDSRKSECK